LVVSYGASGLVLEDGNHRVEGLRRSGHHDYWAVVGFDEDHQRHEFLTEVAPTL
jgi:hypothetical protein